MDGIRDEGQHTHKYAMQFHIPPFVLGDASSMNFSLNSPDVYAWPDHENHWVSSPPSSSKQYSFPVLASGPPPPSISTQRPFEFDSPPSHPAIRAIPDGFEHLSPVLQQISDSRMSSFPPPLPPHSLPLYSASGFDMLHMLAKVAMRPHPRIMLGPVDLTCSFVVVDARQPDHPIVYASPTFCRLTGYSESEIQGRNCRFLQSPSGTLQRGDPRLHTAPDAVRHLYRSLLQDKECQASLINYRKDGAAFVNLVTVIPISEDDSGEITHFVGFQVDLAEQPGAILQKLRDGSYLVNYSATVGMCGMRDRKGRGVSAELLNMIKRSAPRPTGKENERAEVHSLLLDNSDDFIHVLSLKGSLLYIAPSITRILGYNADELIGRSIADLCHPADVVPVMRELKDASSTPMYQPPVAHLQQRSSYQHSFSHSVPPLPPPRPTSLLFRARHKNGEYVWLISRGRLHVEPGKGRKAVVLVGRRIGGGVVDSAGLGEQLEQRIGHSEPGYSSESGWGMVAPNGIVLSASRICTERLGFGPSLSSPKVPSISHPSSPVVNPPPHPHTFSDTGGTNSCIHGSHLIARLSAPGQLQKFSVPAPTLVSPLPVVAPAPTLIGQTLTSLVVSSSGRRIGDVLAAAACTGREEVRKIRCRVKVLGGYRKSIDTQPSDESSLPVEMRFYAREHNAGTLPTSLVFEMVFLEEGDADGVTEVESPTTTLTSTRDHFGIRMTHPMSRHSPAAGPSTATHHQQAFSPSHAAFPGPSFFSSGNTSTSISPVTRPSPTYSHSSSTASSQCPTNPPLLSALSTSPATETSWQYELIRLRFENERMRAELTRLERARRKASERASGGAGYPYLMPPTLHPSLKRPRNNEPPPV